MGRLGRFSKACTTRSRCPCTELPSGLASEHRVRGLCALGSRLQGCAGWLQVRNFYGLPTEQFHQPCALWHASGFYVMAAAAAGHVYVFHVGTAKVCSSHVSMLLPGRRLVSRVVSVRLAGDSCNHGG